MPLLTPNLASLNLRTKIPQNHHTLLESHGVSATSPSRSHGVPATVTLLADELAKEATSLECQTPFNLSRVKARRRAKRSSLLQW